jgi:hypothetical protein
MTTDSESQGQALNRPAAPRPGENMPDLAMSIVIIGAAVMIMVGGFHCISGIAAILDDDFYAVPPGYELAIDARLWGVIHLIGGCLAIAGGVFLVFGAGWARTLALLIALWSAVWSFYSLPYYPTWSWMILALDLGLIWALLSHGRKLRTS